MSQTSSFVKNLASNDRPTRDKAVELLKKYLGSKSSKQLSLLEMEKLWKGLYFAMWYCDRPKTQERLAENLAGMYSGVISKAQFGQFLRAFWSIMIKEWPNVDQWRIDKYYLLMRRVVRHVFIFLRENNWKDTLVDQYLEVVNESVLSGDKLVPMALPYHLCDIYVEELELVIFESLKDQQEELDNLTNEDEEYLPKYEELMKQKVLIASDTPIEKLISPFANLNKNALLKTLREKCKEDVLDDQRLKDWGVVDDSDSEDDDDDDEEDEDEEEWKGL